MKKGTYYSYVICSQFYFFNSYVILFSCQFPYKSKYTANDCHDCSNNSQICADTKASKSHRCTANVVNLSFIVRNRYYLFSYFCVIFYLLFLVVKCSFYNYYCIYADLYLSYVHTYGCVVFVNVSFYNILLNSLVLLPTLPV